MSPAAFGLFAALTATAAPAPSRFASETDAVRLDVIVSRGGSSIAGLSAEDFEVLDNGVPQKVHLASRSEQAVHAVLVLDLSSSLKAQRRAELREAARSFLRKLEPEDKATLLSFTHELRLVAGPAAPATVLDALSTLEGFGSTALQDAIYAGLIFARAAPGRGFVLVFTDGADELSWIAGDRLRLAAERSEATLHIVRGSDLRLGSDSRSGAAAALSGSGPPVRSFEEASLAQADASFALAKTTGGKVWDVGSSKNLEDAFGRVLHEAKNRYLLSYSLEGAPGPGWHKIEVRLKRHKADVRTRRGYFVAAE